MIKPDSQIRQKWADARMAGDFDLAEKIMAYEKRLAARDGSHIDQQIKEKAPDLGFRPNDARNVVEFKRYSQDTIVTTSIKGSTLKNEGGGIRGKITEWSDASRKRLKLHLRNVATGKDGYCLMLTLTYPTVDTDGEKVKKHLQRIRQWLQYHGVKNGCWFLEFQRRGAPHFHAYISASDRINSKMIAAAWCKIINEPLGSDCFRVHAGIAKGSRPCLEPIKKPHAISYYATKYATKSDQKEVPPDYQNVGRFWGVWGDLRPVIEHFWGHGVDSVMSARVLMLNWRLDWKGGTVNGVSDADCKLRWSGTLWGGSGRLDEFLSDAGWCPF